jgi:2-methylcitrate dehydratase PrpD
MAGLTQQLAQFASGLEFGRIPAAAVETVKRGAIDSVGVMFAGRNEPVVRIVSGMVHPGDEASVLFDRGRAVSTDAALVNATAAHALDYDETSLFGHPSVVLVPALAAEGERLGASGAELIAAYVAGYEVWAELVARDADRHHVKGWHPTAVFGPVAAAAAAARLARLDAARTANALGIAAAMSGGLVANFGTMTKPFQAGRAAQSGVLAARLAASGMTGATDALEHRGGLMVALSPAGRVRLDGAIAAGRDWRIVGEGLNIKRYPVCYALHRSIDAALELATANDVKPDQVSAVEVRIGKLQSEILRHSRPQNALDAKFSAEFGMAAALSARRVGLAELTDGFVRSPQVQALMPKVHLETTAEFDPEERLFAPHDSVAVTLAGGKVLESRKVRHAKGHAKNPISIDELRAKFDECVGDALPRAKRNALFERLLGLESLKKIPDLYA